MMCEACERGDHDNCGMQTWCECECEGYGGFNDAYYGLPAFEYDPKPEANDGAEGSG